MSTEPTQVDVTIIGGGPVGLLLGYILNRMKVSVYVVERLDKKNMPMYGRACTLYPRTLEMLDQLDLLDEFLQMGLVARNSANFDKSGQRVNSRGWQVFFAQRYGTFLDYFLNIRLKYSEHLIQDALEKDGGYVAVGWKLKDFTINPHAQDGYRISAVIGEVGSEQTKTLKRYISLFNSKYIIGADGGSSLVRRLSGVPFHLDTTERRWVRIDGVVKTNMPDARLGASSIENLTHGTVLWVPLDHGRSRVGFSLTEEMYRKYGDSMTKEEAMQEAIAAVHPFSLEFESVDWYTLYTIKQGVADRFIINDCIILAGDACHIHSSGAAQGMNTGVHDAINLSWKLGGVLHGLYNSSILETYDSERRSIAEELIRQDKDFSVLISNEIPDAYKNSGLTPEVLLTNRMQESATFILGLGIKYNENQLNVNANSGVLVSGSRPCDALIYRPGGRVPMRLQQVTPNCGSFWVLVFTGALEHTKPKLAQLRAYIDSSECLIKKADARAVKLLTIIDGMKAQGDEALGFKCFGRFYYDPQGEALSSYGFSEQEGGIAVLRPDGYLGFATALDKGMEVDTYF
ncbi:pentachlorophenol 4-monooxygenase, partial [Xylogone sp. PMI_703]